MGDQSCQPDHANVMWCDLFHVECKLPDTIRVEFNKYFTLKRKSSTGLANRGWNAWLEVDPVSWTPEDQS